MKSAFGGYLSLTFAVSVVCDVQVPDGVFCPGRSVLANPKPFPAVPDTFFFVGEVNDPYGNVFSVREVRH